MKQGLSSDVILKKWYEICLLADNVASEVLKCEEAKNDLTVDQMKMLLKYFGDDEFVTVDDDKNIVTIF